MEIPTSCNREIDGKDQVLQIISCGNHTNSDSMERMNETINQVMTQKT